MVYRCIICRDSKKPMFEFPSKMDLRQKWMEVLEKFYDITKIKDHSSVCGKHFDPKCFATNTNKVRRLVKGSVPTIFEFPASEILNINSKPVATQTTTNEKHQLENVQYNVEVLRSKLKKVTRQYKISSKKVKRLQQEQKFHKENLNFINKVVEGVDIFDEEAIILMDLIKNYNREVPRWSETSIRLCTLWRYSCPKGYEYCRQHIFNLPSKPTISRFVDEHLGKSKINN